MRRPDFASRCHQIPWRDAAHPSAALHFSSPLAILLGFRLAAEGFEDVGACDMERSLSRQHGYGAGVGEAALDLGMQSKHPVSAAGAVVVRLRG